MSNCWEESSRLHCPALPQEMIGEKASPGKRPLKSEAADDDPVTINTLNGSFSGKDLTSRQQ